MFFSSTTTPSCVPGVRGMLGGEPDITVVGEAGSGAEAVAAALALRPTWC